MADILVASLEVLNDEKDEKRLALFRKTLPTIIVATIFIAVAMACYGWYKNRIVEHNKETGDMFIDLASGQVADLSVRNNSLDQWRSFA